MSSLVGPLGVQNPRSVFVGNIPYDVTEEELINIFKEVGPVSAFRLLYDKATGKSRGYGFCEYRDPEIARCAMRNLNGYELNGRQLRVDSAERQTTEVRNLILTSNIGNPASSIIISPSPTSSLPPSSTITTPTSSSHLISHPNSSSLSSANINPSMSSLVSSSSPSSSSSSSPSSATLTGMTSGGGGLPSSIMGLGSSSGVGIVGPGVGMPSHLAPSPSSLGGGGGGPTNPSTGLPNQPPVTSSSSSSSSTGNPVEAAHLAVHNFSLDQLYELMWEMKNLVQKNPDQARMLLTNNPPLSIALIEAQVRLGMVAPQMEEQLQQMNRGPRPPTPLLPPGSAVGRGLPPSQVPPMSQMRMMNPSTQQQQQQQIHPSMLPPSAQPPTRSPQPQPMMGRPGPPSAIPPGIPGQNILPSAPRPTGGHPGMGPPPSSMPPSMPPSMRGAPIPNQSVVGMMGMGPHSSSPTPSPGTASPYLIHQVMSLTPQQIANLSAQQRQTYQAFINNQSMNFYQPPSQQPR